MDRRETLTTAALWLLTALLVAVLIVSVALNVAPLVLSEDQKALFKGWRLPEAAFEHLAPTVVSIGALIALLTYWRERRKWEHDKARNRSEFFFRQAAAGLDEVLSLLKDRNNDRVIWVRAARSLLQAQALAEEIELPEYRDAYRLHEQRVRNDLYLALTLYDEATSRRQPLPPQFFFGVKDWTTPRTLDDLAIATSNRPEAYGVDINSLPPEPHLQPLSESSVVAVFDFLDFPKDYKDHLQDVRLWEGDWTSAHGEKAGAARYVSHRRSKFAVGGKLYEKDSSAGRGGS